MHDFLDIVNYLPHREPMMLLDRMVDVDEVSCTCCVKVAQGGVLSLFLDENNDLPCYIAIELIAQTIGVFSGYHLLQNNKPVGLGMILGGKSIEFKRPVFACGSELVIRVEKLMDDSRFASFSGVVIIDNEVVCEGRVNTFKAELDEIKNLVKEA